MLAKMTAATLVVTSKRAHTTFPSLPRSMEKAFKNRLSHEREANDGEQRCESSYDVMKSTTSDFDTTGFGHE